MARIGWAALCVTVFAIGYFLVAWQTPKKIDRLALSTVVVKISMGYGSGVQVAPGVFLTAAHVVERDGDKIIVSTSGHESKAEILWISKDYDVALLRANIPANISSLNCDAPVTGRKVMAVGSPGPYKFVHSWGHIANAAAESVFGWKSVIVVNLASGPGASGGPVFDVLGRVVGIIVGGSGGVPGFAYVVPSSTICSLLLRSPETNG
jgi:S1-C subfamily serine protease